MKNLLRLIALTLCLCFAYQTEAVAQDYKSAVGLRLGYPLAVSYKTFISESSAIEAYVGYRGFSFYNYISINGAYQIHKDISSVDGLQWYFGGGAGVQLYSYDGFDDGSTFITVSGYLGLQYTFPDTPISVTADWVPGFAFGEGLGGFGVGGFGGGRGGLGVRYVLGR
ncbi:MAG: hypothetical protein AB8H12_09815 [Lewinella sp.]